MATKIKNSSLAKETRLLSVPAMQRPGSRQAGLYLLALRSRLAETHHSIRPRKLTISIEPKESWVGAPEPIKINHA